MKRLKQLWPYYVRFLIFFDKTVVWLSKVLVKLLRKLWPQFGQLLIAIDQLLATLLGFVYIALGGEIQYADETISARAWRERDRFPFFYRAIDLIFFWDYQHCKTAYESERNNRQLPPEYRDL